MGMAICKFYGSCFQLFLAVHNHSFCCLILQFGVSYHIILVYYLNYEHTGLKCKNFYRLLHVVILLVISLAANEPEVSPIGLLPRLGIGWIDIGLQN